MKLILVGCLLCFPNALLAQKAKVFGMSYGGLKYPNSLSPSDKGNGGFDLTTKTNIDFGWTVGKGKLIPYVTVYSQADSVGYAYNAKEKITAGIALNYDIAPHSKLSFGVKYDYDYRPLAGLYYDGLGATVDYSYYRSWPLPDGKRRVLAGWANMRYPGSFEPGDESNVIAQGRLTFGRDARIGKSKYSHGPFVAIGAFADTRKKDFNNKIQFDLGVRLKRKIKDMDFTLSAKYRIDHRHTSGNTYSGVIVGLSWFQPRPHKPPKPQGTRKKPNWLSKIFGGNKQR